MTQDPEAGETRRDGEQSAARLERYRVTSGKGFKLADYDPDDIFPSGLVQVAAAALLGERIKQLATLQERLYATKSAAILVIFQGMDAGGKDSTIKHVAGGINPAGLVVTSFKSPTPEENAHDFLWRISRCLPPRGMIGIFNRSHYESVLITRVHPEILAGQGVPQSQSQKSGFWDKRFEDIEAFEHHLLREGTRIVKIFLNIDEAEQKKRLLARLNDPGKLWKFDPSDIAERAFWPAYADAYEAAIKATATSKAPWYVVPANHKWSARLIVAEAMIEAFDGLDLDPPDLSPEKRAALEKARRELSGD